MNEPVGLLVWLTVLYIVLWIFALILLVLAAFTIGSIIYDVFVKPAIENIADYLENVFKKRGDKNENE